MPTLIQTQTMTSTAKSWLSDTVRGLRERLLKDLGDAVESTYRMALDLPTAGLDEEKARKRKRLEQWLSEQARGAVRGAKETDEQARVRHLQGAVKLAAATFLNRLLVRRQMEALGLARVKVVTGGWNSAGFREFREFAPALGLADGGSSGSEGYETLLHLTFEEMALDLPGLFGEVGMTGLIPIPTATLRHTVEALEGAGLSEEDRDSLWRDDTLLGWTYQFWNDPEREALDEKIRNRGKIENHEIAAKTQLFTDRYMVEWLLQNSLGQLWFAICEKNGWTPGVSCGRQTGSSVLDRLEARREEWREKRERGEVDLEALMPLETQAEERWKYWVRRDLPKDAAQYAPATLKEATLLDPACGSGHFLVIAFDLLVALYEEEAWHRGESWSREQIASWIVENNLHGIDIDPRAVQIAAAALWLKVKAYAPRAEPRKMNLVASNLGLGSLPADDPALMELEEAVEAETGIPRKLTRQIVESLKGADYLGSLLKVSESIDAAIAEHEEKVGLTGSAPSQGDLFLGYAPNLFAVNAEEAKRTLLGKLSVFLSKHTGSADLGLRLRGEQLAAGVRFIRMVREGSYDLVVGNPPYQSRGKMADSKHFERLYSEGKADLFAGFKLRALELSKLGGFLGFITLSNWTTLGTYESLRKKLLAETRIVLLLDLGKSAFSASGSSLISSSICLLQCGGFGETESVALRPIPPQKVIRDSKQHRRVNRALLVQEGRHEFTPDRLSVVPEHPLIYWWDEKFLEKYAATETVGDVAKGRKGLCTGDDSRYNRSWFEISTREIYLARCDEAFEQSFYGTWVPTVKGAKGLTYWEPLREIVLWKNGGLELQCFAYTSKGVRFQNPDYYFQSGIAFSMIGSDFTARAHRYRSVFGNKGSSVFPADIPGTLCLMNSALARHVLESLNPGIGFEVGDVNRLPLFPIESADQIVAQLDLAFTEHEQAREASVEFQKPGPSAWTYAQDWAQRAVDRPKGAPLPPYVPVYEPETPLDHLSYALGLALGRFLPADQLPSEPPTPGAPISAIAQNQDSPPAGLPNGILFLSNSGGPDSLDHPATRPLHEAWQTHGIKISKKHTLRNYLREKFFKDDHLNRYEKRPIYLPLSSEQKSFVAWCGIHRWKSDTLQTLLAEHLQPELNRLSGELSDLGQARTSGGRDQQVRAQSRYDQVQALQQELQRFIKQVTQIAERGAPPTDPKCPAREVDARFQMNLDDGVMINSAALWPLLEPQWSGKTNSPKAWWKELCTAKDRKDYDWAHLAARYFPRRVDAKCQEDPSLAVAHGCFWKYHPEKAYQWELRLQSPDELGPGFQLDETDSETLRRRFQQDHPNKVQELNEAEAKRRKRKAAKREDDEMNAFPDHDADDQLEFEEDEGAGD